MYNRDLYEALHSSFAAARLLVGFMDESKFVCQDFEALTPNILARTIETVEGGGMVVILLKTLTSFQQLYTMSMVCSHVSFVIFCFVMISPEMHFVTVSVHVAIFQYIHCQFW